MNAHERTAWRTLAELGATLTEIGCCPALDLSTCRAKTSHEMAMLVDSVVQVVGNSGGTTRAQDRNGLLTLVRNKEGWPHADPR